MAVAIQTEGLTRRFGNVTAVDDVSLSIDEGAIFGFLGHHYIGTDPMKRPLHRLQISYAAVRNDDHHVSKYFSYV